MSSFDICPLLPGRFKIHSRALHTPPHAKKDSWSECNETANAKALSLNHTLQVLQGLQAFESISEVLSGPV